MDNYVLIKSYNKANVQNRLWYSMTKNDLDGLLSDGKISFGDRGYVIQTKKFYVCGNDNSWYEAAESGGGGEAELIEKVISENGVYNASDDGADGYSKVTVDVPGEYYGYPIRTKSGSIATIPDGANNVPIADSVFNIDYDANGYTEMNIGKSAKNLCGGDFLSKNAQKYLPTGTVDTENRYFSYPASASPASGTGGFSGSLSGKFKANTAYTFIITYSKSSGRDSNMAVRYTDNTLEVLPQLPSDFVPYEKYTIVFTSNASKTVDFMQKRNGSGTTRIYYNESGIFEGTLTAQDFEAWSGETHDFSFPLGKNLMEPLTYQRTANNLRIGVDTLDKRISLKAGTYTVSVKTALSSMIFRYVEGGTVAHDLTTTDTTDGRTATFTITANDDSCFIDCYNSNGVTAADISEIMLEKGNEKTTYEPFTYIYGGYFDSVTGMLFSTKAADGTDLEVPDIYELSPVEIRTEEETNIWCDTGDSTIQYRSETFMKEVLKDGVIASTTSQYVTATFDDVSEYDELNITLTLNGVAQYASTTYKVADIGNGVTLTTRMMPTDKSIEFYLTKTSIAASYYTGSWLNITASIVATKSGAISLASKTITANGTYIASAENHDGYSSVVVNVSGGGQTLTLHEGKISMSDGSIVADSDYYYSDFFDAPNGKVIFDIGEIDNDYGLPWYHSDGTYVDHFSASERSRQVNMAVYYQTGDKFRFTFKKSILADAFLIDLVNIKAYCVSAIKLAEE